MNKIVIFPSQNVHGDIFVDADKSITHRSFILAGLGQGVSRVINPLLAEDCVNTLDALKEMGVRYELSDNVVEIMGVNRKLSSPNKDLYLGNSGTGSRLLAGVIAGTADVKAVITGDESLSNRPMRRIIDPLKKMGANISARDDLYLPMCIDGNKLSGIEYELPVASAQVKTCLLLASLCSNVKTIIHEPIKSRNHTELMLKFLDIPLEINDKTITIFPSNNIKNAEYNVPRDISSAAFFIVLGLIGSVEGVLLKDIGINSTRTGIIDVLKDMGANIELRNMRNYCGEDVADIFVKKSMLHGVEISGDRIPLLIDEIPILTLAAIFAKGKTVVKDAKELRYKESDRIKTVVSEFTKIGANIIEQEDGFIVDGTGEIFGGEVKSYGDHRIAMSLIMAGMVAKNQVVVEDVDCINTSFPSFFSILNALEIKFDMR